MNLGFPSKQTPIFPNQVHLIDYLNIIRKRKWVAIFFLLGVICMVTIASLLTTPVYKATVQLIIEEQASFMKGMTDIAHTDIRDMEYAQTQHNILTSRSLAKNVIENLKLIKDLTKIPTVLSGTSSVSLNAQETQMSRMVDWYLNHLEIVPILGTHLVNVGFLSSSPEMAARVANAHARTFIERSMQEQRLFSQVALDWLKEQIQSQKIKVEKSQQAINEYKYEKLGALSIEDESIFSLPEIKESVVIQEFYKKLTELKTRKSEMVNKYGPKHPRMIEIDSSIKQLDQGIVDEVQTIRRKIKAELEQIIALEKNIQRIQGVQQQESVLREEKTINYNMLNIASESNRDIYDVLLKHANEISLTGNIQRNNIRIVDEAEVPFLPVKPRIFLNILLSIILGSTFGIGFCFFLEYMDRKIRTPDDVMKRLGLSVIGMIPYDKGLKTNKMSSLAWGEPYEKQRRDEDISAQFQYCDISDRLIAKLPFIHSGMSGQSFVVESTTSGEGKTTVLAKMAISLSRGGFRVVMVDADLQQPSLHHLFGIKNGNGAGLMNVMNRMLSHEIREGTLNACSIDDLFYLIALRKQSGRLFITSDSQSMTAVFVNGRLLNIQNRDNQFANRLGTMLLRGGFITDEQLKDALDRNQRTGLPLGYILINSGYVNHDQLRGPLKLQKEEYLQKLFSWKQGSFTFELCGVEAYEDKMIYYEDDCSPIINRLGQISGSRLLEREMLSYVKHINGTNLSILPAGEGGLNFNSPACFALFSKFLSLLRQRFDVILVDTPPILNAGNTATTLLSLVDGVIYVIKAGHVSLDLINKAIGTIKESKSKIVGTVLNQVKAENSYYSN